MIRELIQVAYIVVLFILLGLIIKKAEAAGSAISGSSERFNNERIKYNPGYNI